MIYLGSRYETADIQYVLDGRRGETRATVFRTTSATSTEFSYWWWREDDRIDIVALRFFGSPDEWWRILDVNPEILDADAIAVGTKVRIPK